MSTLISTTAKKFATNEDDVELLEISGGELSVKAILQCVLKSIENC